MRFPYFAITILITILCFMLLIKSFDYGQGWAIFLAALGTLAFFILSIIAIYYHMGQHKREVAASAHPDEDHHH